MKTYIQVLCVALAIGGASCFVVSSAQQDSVQNVEAKTSSRANVLLQEFKTAKYFWGQAEVGEKLVALQDKGVAPAMLAMLQSQDRSERCNAGRVLAGLGDDRGLFAVIAELKDTGPRPHKDGEGSRRDQVLQDRYYAADVLRQIGDPRAVPALIETLSDKRLDYQAAIVLGHLDDKRAIPALLASLQQAQASQKSTSPNTDMMFWAGYGLMWLGHPKGLPIVTQILASDRQWIERRYAADALGEFGDKNAVPFLIKALQDKNVQVKVNAITALGKIGDKTAIPALKKLAQDTDKTKGSARIRYETPLFKWTTASEAAAYALRQIENKKLP